MLFGKVIINECIIQVLAWLLHSSQCKYFIFKTIFKSFLYFTKSVCCLSYDLGCSSEIPSTGRLVTNRNILLTGWETGQARHGAGVVGVWWEPLHVADCLLPVSSHDGKIGEMPSSHKGTNSVPKVGLHPHDLITSERPHLQRPWY